MQPYMYHHYAWVSYISLGSQCCMSDTPCTLPYPSRAARVAWCGRRYNRHFFPALFSSEASKGFYRLNPSDTTRHNFSSTASPRIEVTRNTQTTVTRNTKGHAAKHVTSSLPLPPMVNQVLLCGDWSQPTQAREYTPGINCGAQPSPCTKTQKSNTCSNRNLGE